MVRCLSSSATQSLMLGAILPRPEEQFNLNQFGGTLGGPIQKDKTFFFIDYQGNRQRHGIPFVGVIPTPAMKTGDYTNDPFGVALPGFAPGAPAKNADGFPNLVNPFNFTPFQCDRVTRNPLPAGPGGVQPIQPTGTNCNKIPANMIDPTGQAMMNLYPTANVPNNTAFNFASVPLRKFRDDEFDARLDHTFSSKDSAFARFSYDQATTFQPGGSLDNGLAEQGAFASSVTFTNHGRNVAVSETHVFSDRTINQLNAGFNRIFNHIQSVAAGSCLSAKIGGVGWGLTRMACLTCPRKVSRGPTWGARAVA